MRYIDFSNLNSDVEMENKIVSMEEAITAYRSGARVGILNHCLGSVHAVLIMDKDSNFTTDFDYLVNCQWVILN